MKWECDTESEMMAGNFEWEKKQRDRWANDDWDYIEYELYYYLVEFQKDNKLESFVIRAADEADAAAYIENVIKVKQISIEEYKRFVKQN